MVGTFFLLGTLATAGAVLFTWRARRNRPVEALHFFRCPACHQKVRYRASKAGRPAMCPRCLEKWTLPDSPKDLAGSDSYRETSQPRVGHRRWDPRAHCFHRVRRAG
jgi:hypothetical protein